MRWYSWVAALLILMFVSGSAFTAGVTAERGNLLPGSVRVEPTELQRQFSIFWEAWELVERHYVDRSAVDPQEMTYGAIAGMIDSLGDDGHTRFMTPEELVLQSSDIAGRFFGIGAEIGQRDGHPVIVAPMDGSPAEQAGIQAGDIIVEVDGQPVAGMSLDQIVRMIRGPEGEPVRLAVIHPGQMELVEITIVRAQIEVNPVSWAMVPGTDIAHLRLSQFNANANDRLLQSMREIRDAGARAMVVDMRNNVGGLLDQAVLVTSQFVPEGNVVLEQDAQGNRRAIPVERGGVATDIPIVVLVNRGTASGAEIFAGAMQDHERGPVVGETTFGTGTVLSTFSLSDGSAMLLGTSQWLTPEGRQIWKLGITPDEELPLPLAVPPLRPRELEEMTPEEFMSSEDVQILRAVELLSGPR
jgi:carboxyl-terminal processing protease